MLLIREVTGGCCKCSLYYAVEQGYCYITYKSASLWEHFCTGVEFLPYLPLNGLNFTHSPVQIHTSLTMFYFVVIKNNGRFYCLLEDYHGNTCYFYQTFFYGFIFCFKVKGFDMYFYPTFFYRNSYFLQSIFV